MDELSDQAPGQAVVHGASSNASLAARLYAPQQPAIPEPSGNAIADAIYREPIVRRTEEADAALQTARINFLGAPSEGVLAQRQDRTVLPYAFESVDVAAALDPTLPGTVRSAIAAEVREVASDIGADPGELSIAVNLARQVQDMDSDEFVAMERQALTDMAAEYGDRSGDVLGLARRMVAANPQLRRMLDDTGLGSHPRVIKAVIETALRQRAAGRLR